MQSGYALGPFRLDPEAKLLLRGGAPVAVGRRAVTVLQVLVESAGTLVTKERLLDRAWPGLAVEDANLTVQVASLRSALDSEPGGAGWIETLPRRGYRYVGPVDRSGAPPPAQLPPRGASLLGEVRLSITVLPFAVIGGEEGGRAAADALTERLATGLCGVDPLRVIRRATDAAPGAPDACDVATDFLLDGTVHGAAGQWRISVRLVERATHQHIWGVTYEQPAADPLSGLDDIIRNIVATTQITILIRHGERIRQSLDSSGSASDHIAVGLLNLFQHTEHSLAEGRRLAEKALALQPGYPGAMRLVSSIMWHQGYFGFVPIDDAHVQKVFTLAEAALLTNPTSEVYHWTMGLAFLLAKQHARGAACMRRAQELNPHFALGYGSLGTVLAWSGDSAESMRNNRIALQANPSAPDNFLRHFGMALALYFAGDQDGAIEQADKAISMRPSWYLPHMVLTAALAESGRGEAAAAALGDLLRAKSGFDALLLRTLPFTPAGLDRMVGALEKAGLPCRVMPPASA